MPNPQFGLSLTDRPAVGLRHQGDRRLHNERRLHERLSPERRRSQRRKARIRNVLFSALALVLPPQMKPSGFGLMTPQPVVSVTTDSFAAVPAREAYEHIIQEAADRYDLSPSLIRS